MVGQVSDWKIAVNSGGGGGGSGDDDGLDFEDRWLICEPFDPTTDIITEFVIEKLQEEAGNYLLNHIALAVLTGGAGSLAYELYSQGKTAMAVFNLAKLVAEHQTEEGKVEITKALLDELWGSIMP